MSANTIALSKFIEDLNAATTGAKTNLLSLPDKNTVCLPISDIEAIVREAQKLSHTGDTYMPIALFNQRPQKRGTSEEASYLIGLFGDIDTLEKPDPKNGKYAPNKAAALAILKELPFAPTYIIDSGYGLHTHWFFKEPLLIRDNAHREELKSIYSRFQTMLQSVFARHEYALDSGIGDLVRVFRLPGTWNRKVKDSPVPVTVLECYPDNRLTIEEVKSYLDRRYPEKEKPSPVKKKHRESEPDVKLIRKECAWLEHTFNDAEELSEPEWYAALSIIGRCKDGKKIAHEFSKPYPGYTPTDTDKKLEQAITTAEPRTCVNISDSCGGNAYCAICSHWEEITSPIQLGYPERNQSMKEMLLAVCDRLEFWHTKNDTAYVTINEKGHKENLPLQSKKFRKWLSREIRNTKGKIPTKNALDEVLTAMEAEATFDGEQHDIYYRVAYVEGKLYLDTGHDDWSVIEVRADGWEIKAESPVRFVRSNSVQPLVTPDPNGNIMLLEKYIPCENDAEFKLLVGLVLGIYAPRQPYPIGVFTGLQGCGKTTRARAVIRLTDPSSAELVTAPKEDRDVLASASTRWLTSFDNVKKLNQAVSDALCAICTGVAYSSRQYFTNLDVFETTEIARPMLMTGIELRLNQDLRSRSIFFEFSPLLAKDCKTEDQYWKEYEADAPKILGGVLNALSCALKNWEAAKQEDVELPRLADHTVWVTAAEEALGWPTGTYRKLLLAHQKEGMTESDMNSTLGQAVLGYAKVVASEHKGKSSIPYSVGLFYTGLIEWANNGGLEKGDRKYIPRSPGAFSKKLRRLAPSLAYMGVHFEFDVAHEGNKRTMTLTFSPEFSGEQPAPEADDEKPY
jgi:hypothetical protein